MADEAEPHDAHRDGGAEGPISETVVPWPAVRVTETAAAVSVAAWETQQDVGHDLRRALSTAGVEGVLEGHEAQSVGADEVEGTGGDPGDRRHSGEPAEPPAGWGVQGFTHAATTAGTPRRTSAARRWIAIQSGPM